MIFLWGMIFLCFQDRLIVFWKIFTLRLLIVEARGQNTWLFTVGEFYIHSVVFHFVYKSLYSSAKANNNSKTQGSITYSRVVLLCHDRWIWTAE